MSDLLNMGEGGGVVVCVYVGFFFLNYWYLFLNLNDNEVNMGFFMIFV